MEETSKNILLLKEEMNKLTELIKEYAKEHCDLAIMIDQTKEELDKMELSKKVLEDNIMGFKLKKGMLYTLPIGIILSTIFSVGLIVSCLDNLTVGTILFAIIGTPAFSISFSFMLSSFLMHSKKFSNFLTQKYSSLKEMNTRFNNLIVRMRIIEKNYDNVVKRKKDITDVIVNYENIFESIKESLYNLEENSNNITCNSITKGINYTTNTSSKKRTKIKEKYRY